MDYQSWIEGIDGLASLYAFDILPDGKYSEIMLMAVNSRNDMMVHMSPDAPEFYPGIPYRNYWMDLNFENYVYKCAGSSSPLYSYVNARGVWLKGFYIPVAHDWEEEKSMKIPEGARRVYCLYIITFTEDVETDAMVSKSPEVVSAVLDVGIKLHETQDFYQSTAAVVTMIKSFCHAEMCSLYTVDKINQECFLIDENGLQNSFMEKFASQMGRTPYEVAMAFERDLALSDCLLLDDLLIIKERDPVWYESMRSWGISNIILYAIRQKRKIVGFLWAANYDLSRKEKIKEMMELSTFLMAAVIENHQLLSKLEIKSNVDALTQTGNRNAMDEYINGLRLGTDDFPKTMGVVFADLNGLKRVNDQKGHSAGDKLLIRAAALLKLVFEDYLIYRAGGDEFVILCPDIEENKMNELVAQLKEMAGNTKDVSFAVGSVYCVGEYDIRNAIKVADDVMYQDKKEYYSNKSKEPSP